MEKSLKDIDLYEVYNRWTNNSGAFRCFFRSVNFVTLKHYPDFLINKVNYRPELYDRLYGIIKNYNVTASIFVIDLPGEDAITSAFMLQKDLKLKPILTFNNVMHPFALTGTKQYISNLIECGLLLEENEIQGFAFIADQQRYGEYDDECLRRHFNNQYELTEEDLPSYEMLKVLGFDKLVYIFTGEVKEDIKGYMDYLASEGLEVIREEIQGDLWE